MRKSEVFLLCTAINILILCLISGHALSRKDAGLFLLEQKANLVRDLELTDLCLFTEARYTRHLSQADLHTPFQDHPLSLEHFPTGSLLVPPQAVKRINEKLD
jgi:hypothetical protein